MNIVNVQFRSRFSKERIFGGGLYAYIADVPLAVGDIVTVPTANGDGEAMVVRVGIPAEELPKFLPVEKLKHITQPAIPGDAFAGFFN